MTKHSYVVHQDPFELIVHLNMDHGVSPELIEPADDMDKLRARHEQLHIEEAPHEAA